VRDFITSAEKRSPLLNLKSEFRLDWIASIRAISQSVSLWNGQDNPQSGDRKLQDRKGITILLGI
jgi:hypothetical protein